MRTAVMSTVSTTTARTTAACPDEVTDVEGFEICCTRSNVTAHPARS